MTEGGIDNLEYLLTISVLAENLVFLNLLDVQVVTLLNHLLWHIELVLHIVVIFFPTTKALHMLGIVWIVVDSSLCAKLIKSSGKHTFWIHIGESKWTDYFCHTLRTSIFFYSVEQSS